MLKYRRNVHNFFISMIRRKTKGIRINDATPEGFLEPTLPDILAKINNGESFYWSILFLNASGHLGEGKSIVEFSHFINKSERGFFIGWGELNDLAKKFWQIIDILILACHDKQLIKRYENDQDMYETCDIVIELFDSCFWEVFSKNEQIINNFASKFNNIEFLESDFEK